MARIGRAALAMALLPLVTPGIHAAEDKPLWEFGLGAGSLSFPAYRGSDQRSNFLLPVPYVIYRGDVLKADRRGLRGELFDSDRVEFSISAALSPPVSSDQIDARAGMPSLKASAEIGPQLDLTLWRSPDRERQLRLLLPLRAAFTLEGSPRDIGWVAHPKINLDINDLPGLGGWRLGLLAGPLYGDRRQHAYYYNVDAPYATASRPAYSAGGGYAGMQYLAALSRRYRDFWVGAFIRYDNLSGASFADSPLVRSKGYLAGGLAFSWIFAESSTRVRSDD